MGRPIAQGPSFSGSAKLKAAQKLENKAGEYLAKAIEFHALDDDVQAKEARKIGRRLQIAADKLRETIAEAEREVAEAVAEAEQALLASSTDPTS
jgi:hypothetical protein